MKSELYPQIEYNLAQVDPEIQTLAVREPLGKNTNLSVVVPAYCEEKQITNVMDSLSVQTDNNFELVIVDNNSHDNTKARAQMHATNVSYPVSIISELTPGPGHARKTGTNLTAWKLWLRDGGRMKPHTVATTDADTVVPPTWVETIKDLFKHNENLGIAGGVHTGPAWIDQVIFEKVGIPDFFKSIADLNYVILSQRLGKMKLSGPNTAFNLWAAICAGGVQQPKLPSGALGLKEISDLVCRTEQLGFETGFIPEYVISSRRRHLLELIKGKQMYFRSSPNAGDRFITIRADESKLLEHATATVPESTWLEYQNYLKQKIIANTLGVAV